MSENFVSLIQAAQDQNKYLLALEQGHRNYRLEHLRIKRLDPRTIQSKYKKITKKESSQSSCRQKTWGESELKCFSWLLVCYCFLNNTSIQKLTEADYQFFKGIFPCHSEEFIQYSCLCMLKSRRKVSWTEDSVQLLLKSYQQNFVDKNWHTVAFDIFVKSNKKAVFSAKQCRQRWLNHEDPQKLHSKEWLNEQIQMLLGLVLQQGKKWATIAKQMGSVRTEHTVKNKYNSMLKQALRERVEMEEMELVEAMLARLGVNREEDQLQINIKKISGNPSPLSGTSECHSASEDICTQSKSTPDDTLQEPVNQSFTEEKQESQEVVKMHDFFSSQPPQIYQIWGSYQSAECQGTNFFI